MAIKIKSDQLADEFKTENDGRLSIVRKIIFEGSKSDNILHVSSSNLFPAYQSSLPDNAAFMMDIGSVRKCGDIPPLFEALLTYRTPKPSGNGIAWSGSGGAKPWELGIMDWDIGFIESSMPYLFGYDEKGKMVQNVNSAGCQIVAERPVSLPQITFMFNIKSKKAVYFGSRAVINKSAEKINGYTIYAGCGKLMPVGVRHMKVYNNNGNLKWEYYQCSVTILVNPFGWTDEFLDVGTLAKFTRNGKPYLGAIYKYTPWDSKEPAKQATMEPKYGSIDDVIAAKNAYEKIEKGGWAKLPYEEITEPMPLNGGALFTKAIEDPANNPYEKIIRYGAKVTSWSSYGFPS